MTTGLQVELRRAATSDEGFLAELYAQTRAEEMSLTGWDRSEIDAFLRLQFEAQRADYQRRFPRAAHSIVVADGLDVGRIWVDRTSEEIRLLDLAILDAHRGRGIGTRLICELQAESRHSGVPLRHSVVKANADALRLYERLGFNIIGDAPTHHLMEWTAL